MSTDQGLARIEAALKDLKDFEEKNGITTYAYTPCCQFCYKEKGIYMPGCFHEEEQAWVCCQERKTDKGCGRVILTVADFNKRNGKPETTGLYRARR